MTANRHHDQAHEFPSSDSGDEARAPVLPPRKLYSTGEVIEHTRLSRQTLHNYKRLGLIQPARWTEGGHCYYDEAVFKRLRKIKMYQRYHSLQEIRRLLEAEEAHTPDESADEGAFAEEEADATPTASSQPGGTSTAPGRASELVLDAPDANLPDATQWSDNQERASHLAQTLLYAQRFPEKLYRIGDLMRLTGYSRQTLHNYTIQGLLQAKDRTASGHRLYGADAFTVLRLIEVYKRHRRFSEVQSLIEQWYKTRGAT